MNDRHAPGLRDRLFPRPRGSAPARALTAAEVALARSVFGERIDYARVRIVDGKYGFFHGAGYVMAPDGRIYWPGECGDLACGDGGRHAGLFIHEMTHVLQHQRGVNVLLRGFLLQAGRCLSFGRYDPYRYEFDPARRFGSYNIEQQAELARAIHCGRHPCIIDD